MTLWFKIVAQDRTDVTIRTTNIICYFQRLITFMNPIKINLFNTIFSSDISKKYAFYDQHL
jgi:hypothetical protein